MKPVCKIKPCQNKSLARGWCGPHYRRWLRHGDPLGGRTFLGKPLAFLENAARSQTDLCIEWPFSKAGEYGQVTFEGEKQYAHRAVLLLCVGEAEPGQEACHLPQICHNKLCINPRHLRWATRQQNVDDRILDKTNCPGQRNGQAKLTPEQVLQIRKDTRSSYQIAEAYGVSRGAIRAIQTGSTWKHLK